MKIRAVIGGVVIAGAVSASLGETETIKYLGRESGVPTGWIEFGSERYYEIGEGTEIQSWGVVKEIRDDRIVVDQVRTEVEKSDMEERGALVHDVLEIHIQREDLQLLPWGTLPMR